LGGVVPFVVDRAHNRNAGSLLLVPLPALFADVHARVRVGVLVLAVAAASLLRRVGRHGQALNNPRRDGGEIQVLLPRGGGGHSSCAGREPHSAARASSRGTHPARLMSINRIPSKLLHMANWGSYCSEAR